MPTLYTDQVIIGLMSGTSMDGIDAAAVSFDSNDQSGSKFQVIDTLFSPFPDNIRTQINNLSQSVGKLNTQACHSLSEKLADLYAKASLQLIAQSGLDRHTICAIANHGQTIRHCPNENPPYSIQLGDAQALSNLTGIPTISQFRQADLAMGGQGAPLMPAFHQSLFGSHHKANKRFILNIGGIANLTKLGENVIGFDTGPGNTLMDQWVSLTLSKTYDQDGNWARSGNVINKLLDRLLQTAYFHQTYPKSTGTDYFNLDWLRSIETKLDDYIAEDIQATLLALTVETISLGLRSVQADSGEVFVCGGGAQNTTLMQELANQLPNFQIQKTDQLGLPSDWVEAIGFAWLGHCHLNCIPSNLPSVTGAKEAVVLGELFKPKV